MLLKLHIFKRTSFTFTRKTSFHSEIFPALTEARLVYTPVLAPKYIDNIFSLRFLQFFSNLFFQVTLNLKELLVRSTMLPFFYICLSKNTIDYFQLRFTMRFNATENKEENCGSRCGLMQQRIKKKREDKKILHGSLGQR